MEPILPAMTTQRSNVRRLSRAPRTQAERSATTREKLYVATIESLAEVGYGGTTTVEVARRAGLTRGAQLHHFRTKHELVVRAVEHLFERRLAEFLRAFAALPPGTDRLDAAIDLLWETIGGSAFPAMLEVVVAARTDAELHASVAPLTQDFLATVQRTFTDLFAGSLDGGPIFEVAPRFAFAVLEGLALARVSDPTDRGHEAVIDALKWVARAFLPQRPSEISG
jgi:AcrR family transcriptional regulator